ncbi:aspartate carbamoyltransferase [Candidatus Saccharibacteria bacterium RIFCSPHIGHO2_12_FULL_41_12]|nr:MAG: aspartate carbamoyltransferase [Candidatus Saccharibacteria bacterium RIFCSPHIGHO2_12_FULL_41_12]
MHVVSIDQFDKDALFELFTKTDQIKEALTSPSGRKKLAGKHRDKQICTLFYEPSTRTRLSFETAGYKLGFGVVSTESAGQFSSASKGETMEDTMGVLDGYGYSAVIIRHPETGMIGRAAKVAKTPIINAGDGAGEHPTQSLLDTYTIYSNFGRLDNLTVTMGGDLKYGRCPRSLAKVLAKFDDNHIKFVSTKSLAIGQDIKDFLKQNNTTYEETSDIEKGVAGSDVIYWTRLQKERLDEKDKGLAHGFIIDKNTLKLMKKDAIIMHPLPRVDEITTDVDDDPRAKYFEQAGNGLLIRMALLDTIATE